MRISVPKRRSWRLGIVLAAAVALAVPAGVIAGHVFNDVPDSSPFHTDIAALGLAGVTTGCGGGNFCPSDGITREQEAAFLHRGLGRVSADESALVALPPDTFVNVASLTITPGYTSGKLPAANGFLKIDGAVTVYEINADTCDCFIRLELYVDGVRAGGQQYVFLNNDADDQLASAGITAAVPVSAVGPRLVELRLIEYIGDETLEVWANLTALYVPFGSTGIDTLGGTSSSETGSNPGE
jgi:hypothetical protein